MRPARNEQVKGSIPLGGSTSHLRFPAAPHEVPWPGRGEEGQPEPRQHGGGGATTLRVYAAWVAASDQRAAEVLGAKMPKRHRGQATTA